MNLLFKLLSMLIGYIFGSFLTAVVVAKKFTGKDISEIGTGNPGMANTMAQIGKKAGFIVLGGDILKTVIAMTISAVIFYNSLGISQAFLWTGLGALLGHNFPVTRKFKGGKGVTVTCVWIILLLPFSGILSAVAGGLVVVLTGLLPLGAVLITFFVMPFAYFELGTEAFFVMLLSFCIMLFRHFPGFIRGFKNQEKREFKKGRSVKSIVLSIIVIALVYIIGFGRYYLGILM